MAGYEDLRRQALLSNIGQNMVAMGNRTAPQSPSDVLTQLSQQERMQRRQKMADQLQQRQEQRLQSKFAFEQEQAMKAQQRAEAEQVRQAGMDASFTQMIQPGGGPLTASTQQGPVGQPGTVQGQSPTGQPTEEAKRRAAQVFQVTGDKKAALKELMRGTGPMTQAEQAADEDRDRKQRQDIAVKQGTLELARAKYDNELQNASKAEKKAMKMEEAKWGTAIDRAGSTLGEITRIAKNTNALTQGPFGWVTSFVPGMPAKDYQAAVDVLLARQTTDEIARMKEQSITGATGFGQLNREELHVLQTTLSNLSQSTTEKEKLYWLNESYRQYNNVYTKLQESGQEQGWKYESSPGLPGYDSGTGDYTPPSTGGWSIVE